MAGCDLHTATRKTVAAVNGIFLIFGIVIVAVGFNGYNQSSTLKQNADQMNTFDLPMITIIVAVCGIFTIATAVLGIIGAYFSWANILKIYVLIIFCVIGVEIALGAYLNNLNTNDLRARWEENTTVGQQRREAYQKYFTCCGFEQWTDSLGALNTSCPYMPDAGGNNVPTTCLEASKAFLKKYIAPVAAAAITIGVLQLVVLMAACFILYKGKDKDDWINSEFHY